MEEKKIDILIEGEKVVGLGHFDPNFAEKVIDASGKIIAQDNQFTGQKGYGRFIKRRIGEDVLTSPSWQRRVKC